MRPEFLPVLISGPMYPEYSHYRFPDYNCQPAWRFCIPTYLHYADKSGGISKKTPENLFISKNI